MEIQVFLCKGQGLHPKNWVGEIEGTPVSTRMMKVSRGNQHSRGVENGGQSGIPDPGGFGGGLDSCPSLFWRGSSEEGGGRKASYPSPLIPWKRQSEAGFPLRKLLEFPLLPPRADFGVIPVRSGWVFFRI